MFEPSSTCIRCKAPDGLMPMYQCGNAGGGGLFLKIGAVSDLIRVSVGFSCKKCWDVAFSRAEELGLSYLDLIDLGVHPKIAMRRIAAEEKEPMTLTQTICRLIDTEKYVSARRNLTKERLRDAEVAIPAAKAFLDRGLYGEAAKALKYHPEDSLWKSINTRHQEEVLDLKNYVEDISDEMVDTLHKGWEGISARFPRLSVPRLKLSTKGNYLLWETPTTSVYVGVDDNNGDTFLIGKNSDTHTIDRCRNFEFGEASMAWFLRVIYD